MSDISIFKIDSRVKVTQIGYRKAVVGNPMISIGRHTDEGKKLEDLLVAHSGARPDNHVVYVLQRGSSQLGFFVSDGSIRIGPDIIRGNW